MTAIAVREDLVAMANRIGADLAGHILEARAQNMPPQLVAEATQHAIMTIKTAGEGVLEEGEIAELQSRVVQRAQEILCQASDAIN